MHKTVVLNVVGLTPTLLGPSMPALSGWAREAAVARIASAFPAVTCTAQSDYVTGRFPETHGIVGNGWYAREDAEVRFWKQSNRLVQAPKIWDTARAADPAFTCANLFWWYNMYSTAEYSVTPRPMYPADGRKVPDVYTTPPRLRDELQSALGTFPLFEFWGPRASIRSTQWIAESAKQVDRRFNPTLTLVYLPHLDYNLQRVGPGEPSAAADLRLVDDVCGDLIRYYESRDARVIVLSEYGLRDVSSPIHLNRVLREHGLLAVRDELGHEMIDPGASAAFAVADHQVAHVYVNDPSRAHEVRAIVERTPGVEAVLDQPGKRAYRIDHARAGDLIAVSEPGSWFTYYYWLDDRRAPDYARTVDIHRKPGYDPVELFVDPAIRIPALTVGWKLAKRKAGLRSLLDVIPLDASLVKGSHGRRTGWDEDGPVFISRQKHLVPTLRITSVDVHDLILGHLNQRFQLPASSSQLRYD
jgi:predicted AlkP superfamily pyrophosphatase or phosphodiesterase